MYGVSAFGGGVIVWRQAAAPFVAPTTKRTRDYSIQSFEEVVSAAPQRLATASNQNVNPGVAALTLTGFAPTIAQSANQSVNPSAAALTLAGFAPTLAQSANQVVSPAQAALSLTGYAPTVGQTQSVSPSAAALTLAGYAPTIQQLNGQNVIPGPAQLTLVGYAPTLAQTGAQSVSPGPAALGLTGYAPTIFQDGPRAVTPGPAALTLYGYAPTIAQAAVVTDPCAVVWDTTQDANFKLAFPEFAAVPFARTSMLFEMAQCTLLDNSCGSPVTDTCYRTHLFYLLVGHMLLLFGLQPTLPDNTPPGRINNATEGTITSGFEYILPPGSMSAPWYIQTKYGAMYWTATVRFRSLRYVPNGSSGIGFSTAYGVAPVSVPGGI